MGDVGVCGEVEGVGEDGGGVAVGEVHQQLRDAGLVGGYALGGQEELEGSGVAGSGRGGLLVL